MSGLTSHDNEVTASTNPSTSAAFTTEVDVPKSQEVYRSPPNGLHENEVRRDNQSRNRGRGFRPNSSSSQRNNGGFRNTGGFTDDRVPGSSHHRRNYNQRRNFERGNRNRHDDVNYKEEYDFEKPNAELAEFLEKIDLDANSNVVSEHGDDGHQEEDTYDSSKSFFDTLSSELMDRANGIVKNRSHREDRKQNYDTFGPAANRLGSYRGSYRSRRAGSGGNYRGNQHGGYRYNISNNRQHSNYQNRRDAGESTVNTKTQPQQ
ncbi:hypothetical protein Aperf_G00000053922 [Anoplocephala perfoliata]